MRMPAEGRSDELIAATVDLMRRESVRAVTILAIAKRTTSLCCGIYGDTF